MKNKNRIIYAVVGVVVLLFAGLVYAWSVISAPIGQEFSQWTKAQLSMTFTIVMIVFCVGQILCGLFASRLSPKLNVWVASVLFLLGFFISSRTQSLVMLYLGFGVLCGLASGLAYNAVISTVVKWFPDKPGFISGVLLMGFGIGSFVVGKLFQMWTPETVGAWRGSFMVMGIVISVVLAICAFFIETPGKDYQVAAAGSGKKAAACLSELNTAQMLKQPSFWLYYVWAIMLSAAGLALISQSGAIVREVNPAISIGSTATIVGLISIFNAAGRVIFGSMYDKRGRALSMQLVNALFIVTALVLIAALYTGSIVILILGFVIGGLAYSGVTPCNAAFIRNYFGAKNYSMNFPMINTNLVFASFGSTVSGALFDASQSYVSTFALISVLAVMGILCSLGIDAIDRKRK